MKSVAPNSAKAFRYDEEGGIGYGTIDEGTVRTFVFDKFISAETFQLNLATQVVVLSSYKNLPSSVSRPFLNSLSIL